jgi:hypothetical protein
MRQQQTAMKCTYASVSVSIFAEQSSIESIFSEIFISVSLKGHNVYKPDSRSMETLSMEMSHIDGECQVFSSIPIGNSTGTWLL